MNFTIAAQCAVERLQRQWLRAGRLVLQRCSCTPVLQIHLQRPLLCTSICPCLRLASQLRRWAGGGTAGLLHARGCRDLCRCLRRRYLCIDLCLLAVAQVKLYVLRR